MSNPVQESSAQIKPPQAKKQAKTLESHGHVRQDPYYWLRQRENPEVLAYLNAENEYMKSMMAPVDPLRSKLFDQTVARIKQTDVSVPYPENGYQYYSRTEDGKQYSIYCRKKGDLNAAEAVILDVNELAKGHAYCGVSGMEVSPDTRILAYAVDTVGRRKYTLQFKNLDTGELLADRVPDITGNLVWANDNKTVFYTKQDPQTLRSYQIFRHELGTDPANDVLVFEEKDEEFSCYVSKSRSRKFILISSFQTLSSDVRYLDADNPTGELTVLQPRQENHEYSADHFGEHFYLRTNREAPNFCLMKTPEKATTVEHWQPVVPHSDDEFFSGFELFDSFLAIQVRSRGLMEIRFQKNGDTKWQNLEFNDPAYVARITATPESDTTWLRYGYTSMTTPNSSYEYNIETGERRLLKQTEVLGGFKSEDYRSERRWATVRDGVKVPVSIVYHKDTKRDGSAPCLLYAYGSYGSSMDASFNSTRLNLLDRGFVYAIAHIRGGQELGRHWYENGKLLKKMNTFTDFVDVGKFLIEEKYSDPKRLYGRGGSAGGLLIGAAINLRPDLFHGVIADVPFVDVVTTMLDDSIPLTTSEYDEWGNPNIKEYYDYMLSYSPYDNVRKADYPNILVTTGLHDSQVQYWEPAKWVARLREMKTDENLLLLKTNMEAGHGGASGRYDRYKEVAFRHAYLLMLAGIEE